MSRGVKRGQEWTESGGQSGEGHSSSFVVWPQVFQSSPLAPTPPPHNPSELWRTPVKAGGEDSPRGLNLGSIHSARSDSFQQVETGWAQECISLLLDCELTQVLCSLNVHTSIQLDRWLDVN
ncbi:unnamed protein product [Pleuronectes platessa]|uniref:Uncharacterized protein n=1 Tax=Pleuronectes platessa TaxID=8262 RepID=A0A9N7V3V2_PLEPL|nr:unnamed protein product [Pleuronectes platessa]